MNKLLHLFRLGWAYKISPSTRFSFPPYQYTIEPTNRCNLKCSFCPQSNPDHHALRPQGYLSMGNFALFLRRIAQVAPGNKNINLTLDGEPFKNKDFLCFVEMAVGAGRFPIFATNATMLNQAAADRLIAAGPFRASIDFASDKKVFEAIRGRRGHFDLVCKNLAYLMEKSRNCPGIHLDVYDITPFAGVDAPQSLRAMRDFFPAALPSRIRFTSRQFHNFCGHLKREEGKGHYRLCPYPWTQMAVTFDGNCVPCCRDTAGRSVLGNVFDEPIMNIWNNEQYRRFRGNLLKRRPDLNAACAECDLPYSAGRARWRLRYLARSLLGR